MASTSELIITLHRDPRVEVRVGRHLVRTDQPADKRGTDSAPSPFDLFLASIGACAGVFVQGFCATRGLSAEQIRIRETPSFDEQGVLVQVALTVELPADFPEKYRDALIRTVEQCSVKRAIAAQPVFTVKTSANVASSPAKAK